MSNWQWTRCRCTCPTHRWLSWSAPRWTSASGCRWAVSLTPDIRTCPSPSSADTAPATTSPPAADCARSGSADHCWTSTGPRWADGCPCAESMTPSCCPGCARDSSGRPFSPLTRSRFAMRIRRNEVPSAGPCCVAATPVTYRRGHLGNSQTGHRLRLMCS